jgi:flagellar basal-body rod protein FlgB
LPKIDRESTSRRSNSTIRNEDFLILPGPRRKDSCNDSCGGFPGARAMQMATPMAEALNRYLDLSSLELKATAQNMANIDTPGYQTTGFDFASEMSRSLDSLSRQGGSEAGSAPEPQLSRVGGLLARPDGNDVSMDREGLKMAEAQLQFRTGAELLKHEFSRVLDAIHEDQK